MGLKSRLGIAFRNFLSLIPVGIIWLVSAILASIGASKAKGTSGKLVKFGAIALWAMFIGGLILIIPLGAMLVGQPYIHAFAFTVLSVFNLILAGVMLYGALTNKKTFLLLLICSIMLGLASLFMVIHSIRTVRKYRKGGGFTGDVKTATQIVAAVPTGGASFAAGAGTAAVGQAAVNTAGKAAASGISLQQVASGIGALSNLMSSRQAGQPVQPVQQPQNAGNIAALASLLNAIKK